MLKRRKGLDRPVYLVAAIALAIMFVALYFSGISNWFNEALSVFNSQALSIG